MNNEFLKQIQIAANIKILYSQHALTQMLRPERMIEVSEVKDVVNNGEMIEDYPEDSRGHSCLMLGSGNNNRPIHIVCAPKENYLAIITAYPPDPLKLSSNFRIRV